MPDDWESLRRRWEFSHVTLAARYFLALVS